MKSDEISRRPRQNGCEIGSKTDILCDPAVRYFDFTASALALRSIEEQMIKILPFYANTHSASGRNSRKMSAEYARAKERIRASLGIGSEYALIALGSGSSAAIKRFCELMGVHASPALLQRLAAAGGAVGGAAGGAASGGAVGGAAGGGAVGAIGWAGGGLGDPLRGGFANPRQTPQTPQTLQNIAPKTLIIVSALEHHSNELGYREGLCDFARLGLRDGRSDLFELERRCKDFRRKCPAGRLIIAASAASNITGVRNDLRAISELARCFGAVFFIDATAALPYENLPAKPDAFAFSAHKFLGGCGGPGFLCIKKELTSDKPTFAAGGTVEYVDRQNAYYVGDCELLEEGGTPPILGVIKASLAIAHRDAVGLGAIAAQLERLRELFCREFLRVQFRAGLTLYAASVRDRLPIFAMNAARVDPFEWAAVLARDYGIESRAGCACAGPYTHDLMSLSDGAKWSQNGKPGFLRVGLHYTHDDADVKFLVDALAQSALKLRR